MSAQTTTLGATLPLPHGLLRLPAFFPDGTYGAVRCAEPGDLVAAGVPGLVMNAFHLLSKPGLKTLRAMGGLHAFTGWDRPILTDSGGFQVFSLIRENEKFGQIRANEIIFRPEGGKDKVILTPEKSIQSQFVYASDVMMCLDYCTHIDDTDAINRQAVDTTIAWAARCKAEYEKQLAARGIASDARPLLFGIIQGGGSQELRKRCANALIDIGFDGFGFGGWPLDKQGNLASDVLAYTAALMPDNLPKYAMGLGRPEGIVQCARMGYNLFDCVIPTREARHNRLYVFRDEVGLEGDDGALGRFFYHHYILDDKYAQDARPVSETCDCYTCTHHSRAYLRHLYKMGDGAAYRLGTIHNLRFYTRLLERIASGEGLS
jgi:queuine tRNA-ribosyltransferase